MKDMKDEDDLLDPLLALINEGTNVEEFVEQLGFEHYMTWGSIEWHWRDDVPDDWHEWLPTWEPNGPEGYTLIGRWLDANDGDPTALFVWPTDAFSEALLALNKSFRESGRKAFPGRIILHSR